MHRWKVATTKEFDAWFKELGASAKGRAMQAEVIAHVELLKIFGPSLGRPHVDTLNGSKHANMKELRAATAEAVVRVAFAFDSNRAAILLCAGDKTGVNERRFYRQLIARADRLFDSHLERIQAAEKKGRR